MPMLVMLGCDFWLVFSFLKEVFLERFFSPLSIETGGLSKTLEGIDSWKQ